MLLLVITFLFIIFMLHIIIFVNPTIKKISEEHIKALTIVSVNDAVTEIITDVYTYDDFISITKDSENNITLIEANSVLINVIMRNATLSAQQKISELGGAGIDVPIGSLSGLTFLAGRGAEFHLKILPIGVINSKINSEFISAGINQTIHKITLNIHAEVNVILPGIDSVVSTTTPIIIAENVIVGKIPQFYIGTDSLGGILNLAP